MHIPSLICKLSDRGNHVSLFIQRVVNVSLVRNPGKLNNTSKVIKFVNCGVGISVQFNLLAFFNTEITSIKVQ